LSKEKSVILIAYDGSDDAKAAIAAAARLFPGVETTVLTVWQRLIDTLTRSGAAAGVIIDYDEVDQATESAAQTRSQEGSQLALDAGLQATPLTSVVDRTVSEAILDAAHQVDASAIVMGTRGLAGIKEALLGSVSHGVIHRADLPVVVIPAEKK
jgi:nucleotide-binding universal stress UspA family protein